MKYFAYGSNMSLTRLKNRVPSAVRLGTYILIGHQLRFHKSSDDGSSKCDAFQTYSNSDAVVGALFDINNNEKSDLDQIEGLGEGYSEKRVKVANSGGEFIEATTYYAIKINAPLKPYSWYLNHVIIGAIETDVPAQYLASIQSIEPIQDPDANRDKQERAMYDANKFL